MSIEVGSTVYQKYGSDTQTPYKVIRIIKENPYYPFLIQRHDGRVINVSTDGICTEKPELAESKPLTRKSVPPTVKGDDIPRLLPIKSCGIICTYYHCNTLKGGSISKCTATNKEVPTWPKLQNAFPDFCILRKDRQQ